MRSRDLMIFGLLLLLPQGLGAGELAAAGAEGLRGLGSEGIRGLASEVLRLRGGGQGLYIDAHRRNQQKGRMALRTPGDRDMVRMMMNLTEFPESLDPQPIKEDRLDWRAWDPVGLQEAQAVLRDAPYNTNRVVYNVKGGEEKAYMGRGIAGMEVEEPRKWPYAVPEVIGHRSWKKHAIINGTDIRKRSSASAMRITMRTSWRDKMELKEKKAALRGVVNKLRIDAVRAKETTRLLLQARRKIVLENRLENSDFQLVTNPKKIAAMNKKQRQKLRSIPSTLRYETSTPAFLRG